MLTADFLEQALRSGLDQIEYAIEATGGPVIGIRNLAHRQVRREVHEQTQTLLEAASRGA